MGTNNDTAVAATAATATATTTRAAAVMIQQQQLVNINLLFPLLLSNTDISHGGDLKPKEVRSLKPPEVNQILREASQEEGGHGAAKVAMVMRRMSRGYGEEPGFFKMSMNVSAPVQIGKQMTVSCNANRALELCVFKPPFAKKATMFTPATQLEYGRIKLSERAKGDPKICEILVNKVEKKDLGDWRCVVGCTCYQNEGGILTVTETPQETEYPVDAHWANWESWSPCSRTCGRGTQRRYRRCNVAQNGGSKSTCTKGERKQQSCNNHISCPVDAHWANWESWSPCSTTCGRGTQRRY